MLEIDETINWFDEKGDTIMESPKYYALSLTGKVLEFSVKVIRYPTKAEIISFTGYYGGKITQKSTFVHSGKNKGKVNETTISTQAINEAQSLITSKQKEGYKNIPQIIERLSKLDIRCSYDDNITNILDKFSTLKFNTDHFERFQPMLAKTINWDNLPKSILWQPKYNGVRCRVHIEGYRIKLISREGEEYYVEHIMDELSESQGLMNLIGEHGFLDGELYIHNMKLQDIVKLVKTPCAESLQIQYVVYDIGIHPENNIIRYTELEEFINKNKFKQVVLCPTKIFHSTDVEPVKEELLTLSIEAYLNNYEGGMVRDAKSIYYFGFRPTGVLQKIKFDKSSEFKIIGYTIPDSQILEDFVYKCVTPEGKEFEVKPHGTIEERLKVINNIDSYIGKKLQLSFYEYTKDKIPFHITEVTIRDYE